MYELPTAIGLIPDLGSVAGGLGLVGALWLATSALGFGALIPLAARRPRTESLETAAGQSDVELSEAA